MCPLCLANAVVLGASATSGGGVAALVASRVVRLIGKHQTNEKQNETSRNENAESGLTAAVGGGATGTFGKGEEVDPRARRAGCRASTDAVAGGRQGVRVRRAHRQGALSRSIRWPSSVDNLSRVLRARRQRLARTCLR